MPLSSNSDNIAIATIAPITVTGSNINISGGLSASFPGSVIVTGSVIVSNIPAIQAVSGTIAAVVQNWPATIGVSASVPLQVWNPGTVGVSGSINVSSQVSVNNYPATQNISGTVASVIQNWPAVLGMSASVPLNVWNAGAVGISGSVTLGSQVSVNNFPAVQSVSGSVQGIPGGVPVQVWSAGTIGISGTVSAVAGVTQTAQNVSSSSGLRVWNESSVGVSGTVGTVIQNWPAIHGISASVPLQVWSAGTTGVSGSVTVANSQLSVNNFPAVQNVSGSVAVGTWAANVTASVQIAPGAAPLAVWNPGTIGVSGSLTVVAGVTQTAQNVSSSLGLRVYNDSAVGVSGTVAVVIQNWPAVHGVSASSPIQVWNSATVGVSGTVTLGSQVSVNNYPAIQAVSGSVSVTVTGSTGLHVSTPVSNPLYVTLTSSLPVTFAGLPQLQVSNFPATQNVSGSVTIGSFGTNVTSSVQGVPGGIPVQIWSAGTIGVSGSFTTTQGVTQTAQNVSSSAGLRVYNDSAVGVSGTVTLGSQVSVNNFPAVQAVSGTVTVSSFGTNVTASVQGVPGGVPVQIWSAGIIGVSGTLTSVVGVTQTAQNVSSSAGLRVYNDSPVGISGSIGVTVQNWPAIHGVSASVPLQVWSAGTTGISGTVTLANSQLSVNNFPAVQAVSGSVTVTVSGSTGVHVAAPATSPLYVTVTSSLPVTFAGLPQLSVNNFPATQNVSGSVGSVIQNWPSTLGVSASVPLSVFNAGVVGVSGTVTLGSQVSVNNFPAVQNISGAVTIASYGTNVTSSIQGVPGGVPVQIWSAGTVGVSGSLTVVQGVTQTAQNVSSSLGLRVYNDSAVGVSGTVSIAQQVSVNNYPATQNVSGTITIGSFGTLVTASIQGVPNGIPIQIWSAGAIGVSGTLTSIAGVTQTAQNVSSSGGLRVWNESLVGISGTVGAAIQNWPAVIGVSSSVPLSVFSAGTVGVSGSVVVSSQVSVNNFPAIQAVSGSLAATIQNWPAVLGVSASVPLQVWSASNLGVTGSVSVTVTGSTGLHVSAPIYNPIPIYNVAPGTTASAWVKLGFAPNSTDGALVSTQVAVAQPTYAAATGRFTPSAGATDIWVLQGSATRTVKVHTITFTASGSTGAVQLPFQLLLRSTGNSGGSSGTITPVSYDSLDSVATAKCYNYTANATSLGTLVGTLKVDYLNLVSSSVSSPVVWSFGSQPFRKPIYLRGINQLLCINLSGSNPATGFQMAVDVEFTEES